MFLLMLFLDIKKSSIPLQEIATIIEYFIGLDLIYFSILVPFFYQPYLLYIFD